MKIDLINLADITADKRAQLRELGLRSDVVAEYREAMEAHAHFPPIVVFKDDDAGVHWLSDGWHRYHAAKRAGRRQIEADVRQGDLRAAILHAAGANAVHGLRRTDSDKRLAIKTLLEDEVWRGWSDRKVAEACGVSDKTVASMRRELGAARLDLHLSDAPAPPRGYISLTDDPPAAPDPVKDKAALITSRGGEPRIYRNKQGSVSVMDVSRIGRRAPAVEPERAAGSLAEMVQELRDLTLALEGPAGVLDDCTDTAPGRLDRARQAHALIVAGCRRMVELSREIAQAADERLAEG
jgi:hypothetical protein